MDDYYRSFRKKSSIWGTFSLTHAVFVNMEWQYACKHNKTTQTKGGVIFVRDVMASKYNEWLVKEDWWIVNEVWTGDGKMRLDRCTCIY